MKIIIMQSLPIYFDICSVHLATWRTIKSLSISQILLSLSFPQVPDLKYFYLSFLISDPDPIILSYLVCHQVSLCSGVILKTLACEDTYLLLLLFLLLFLLKTMSSLLSFLFFVYVPYLSSFFSPFLDPQSLEIVLRFLLFSLQWRTSNPKRSIEIDWQMIRCTCSRRCLFMVLCEEYSWCESVYV